MFKLRRTIIVSILLQWMYLITPSTSKERIIEIENTDIMDEEDNFSVISMMPLPSENKIPPTMSIEIKYKSSGTVERRKNIKQGEVLQFRSDFIQISIECNSSYPKRWSFSTSLVRDANIIDWFIDKTRLGYGNDSTSYSFVTHLVLIFLERKSIPFEYIFICQELTPKNSPIPSLNSSMNLNVNRSGLVAWVMEGQQMPKISLQRFGRNVNCSLRLYIDRINKRFGCTDEGDEQIQLTIISCNDNDECSTMVQTNNNCPNATIEVDHHLNLKHMLSFVNRSDSGIFLCEVASPYNSMAAKFYFTLNEPKILYLKRDEANVTDLLNLRLLNSSKEVYTEGKNVTLFFNCSSSASSFSDGFYWILEYADGSLFHLGSDYHTQPNYLEFSQAYTTLKEINFHVNSSHNVTVYCLAPKWNSYSWENISIPIYLRVGNSPLSVKVEENSKNDKLTILIGSILCFCTLLIILVFLGILYIRKRTNSNFEGLTQDEIDEFLHGDAQIHDDALFYPYNTDYEITRKQFQIDSKILGSGEYGRVTKGRIGIAPVAIKTVKKSADIPHLKALLSELKIMCFVGRHDHIVSLIGACTENISKREVFLLVEFCENGNLITYLKSHRASFINYWSQSETSLSSTRCPSKQHAPGISNKHKSVVEYQNASTRRMSTRDLVRWSFEIASGMEHLSSKNVIHGDLAARNILLTANLTAKVSDFGLSKQLYDYSVYVQRIACPLPLRWMAIESLRDLEFSKESDVWSFGITLWEIYSLGHLPYPAIEWDFESWKLIRDGYRMDQPEYASSDIYKIMLDCWKIEPEARPQFWELREFFQELSFNIDPDCVGLNFCRNPRTKGSQSTSNSNTFEFLE